MTNEENQQQETNNNSKNVGVVNVGESEKIVENTYTDPNTGKFKPGNPGKPLGAKKKKPSIWDYLEDKEDEQKIREFINDPKFLDKVAEYILGKPKQPLVGGDEDDEPIKIKGINYILPDGNNSSADTKTTPSISSSKE